MAQVKVRSTGHEESIHFGQHNSFRDSVVEKPNRYTSARIAQFSAPGMFFAQNALLLRQSTSTADNSTAKPTSSKELKRAQRCPSSSSFSNYILIIHEQHSRSDTPPICPEILLLFTEALHRIS
jgi:hypothetical protein